MVNFPRMLRACFLLGCLLTAPVVHAHEVTSSRDPERRSHTAQIDATIKQKLEFYNEKYPGIQFVHVDGGADWRDDMVAVMTLLGSDADALDYEHAPKLREALLEVTLERLRRFLAADVVSATLFRVGQDSIVGRPNLCVITLNPEVFVASDYEATQYMLDVSDEVMQKVHPARYLDHFHHLEFSIDHEAYHCLDSYFYGGAPKTFKTFGGDYNLFRRETVADAYAMTIHIKTHGRITPYARNIVHARALWMFTDSPNRCTFETIREVLKHDPKVITATEVRQLIGLAVHIRNRTVGDYDAYLAQRTAALAAAIELGTKPEYYGTQWEAVAELESNPAVVAFLLNRYQYFYSQLFTDIELPLEAPLADTWKKPVVKDSGAD